MRTDEQMQLKAEDVSWDISGMRARGLTNRPCRILAFYLTWRTYGTWLPGDDRGWVKFGRGSCILDAEQRELVERTITDHCRIRAWELHAVNCWTNHVHVVVGANCHPNRIREQFKAWATRKLKELERTRACVLCHQSFGLELSNRVGRLSNQEKRSIDLIRENWWAERGSSRWIGDEETLEAAIRYVRDGQ